MTPAETIKDAAPDLTDDQVASIVNNLELQGWIADDFVRRFNTAPAARLLAGTYDTADGDTNPDYSSIGLNFTGTPEDGARLLCRSTLNAISCISVVLTETVDPTFDEHHPDDNITFRRILPAAIESIGGEMYKHAAIYRNEYPS